MPHSQQHQAHKLLPFSRISSACSARRRLLLLCCKRETMYTSVLQTRGCYLTHHFEWYCNSSPTWYFCIRNNLQTNLAHALNFRLLLKVGTLLMFAILYNLIDVESYNCSTAQEKSIYQIAISFKLWRRDFGNLSIMYKGIQRGHTKQFYPQFHLKEA